MPSDNATPKPKRDPPFSYPTEGFPHANSDGTPKPQGDDGTGGDNKNDNGNNGNNPDKPKKKVVIHKKTPTETRADDDAEDKKRIKEELAVRQVVDLKRKFNWVEN